MLEEESEILSGFSLQGRKGDGFSNRTGSTWTRSVSPSFAVRVSRAAKLARFFGEKARAGKRDGRSRRLASRSGVGLSLSLSGRRRRLLFLPVYTSVLKLPPLRDSSGFSSAHARFRFFRKHSHFSLSSDAGKFMRACLLARPKERSREVEKEQVIEYWCAQVSGEFRKFFFAFQRLARKYIAKLLACLMCSL